MKTGIFVLLLTISVILRIASLNYCDAPVSWQVSLQDSATPNFEGMHFFHNYILLFLLVVGITVGWLLWKVIILFNESTHKKAIIFTHAAELEIGWTLLPALILLMIAIPSFTLLYSLDDNIDPSLTLKVVGHQWYWSYEFSDFYQLTGGKIINFDSYIVNTEDLTFGAFRLLEVDNRLILPINLPIRLLITSADVLHSWAVPSFGIKIDACPGRLSQGSLFLKREGVFYGQCSEICGINHGFMPIVVKSVNHATFLAWISKKLDLGN
jgi:cytochrome c oxidase subunit 2